VKKLTLPLSNSIWIRIITVGIFLFAFGSSPLIALDTINLSRQIADSLNQVDGQKYKTVAFSKIQGNLQTDKINELIDYTNVAIVRSHKFKVIDRSKLQLILNEQKFNLSGMVSTDTYKELGRLLGVDLFIYGNFYKDTITIKAIDVESSAIIWADFFEIAPLRPETKAILNLSQKMVTSIRSDLERFKKDKIHQISFWSIKSEFKTNQIIDFLSVTLTADKVFQVVDRDNLRLILEEQKLGMLEFIDENKAKKMGELYGVDAFIYGSITSKKGQFVASLKLLNIYNGVIEWADLISFSSEKQDVKAENSTKNMNHIKGEMVFVPSGRFIMGSNEGDRLSSPQFTVNLSKGYYIDRTEVSNENYKNFIEQYRHRAPPYWVNSQIPPGQENLPVVEVSWNDASLYCKKNNKRLPTEAEWEKAFRGESGRKYPWEGDEFKPNYARTLESAELKPLDVEADNRDVSVYGVQHMAGNVREWVDDYLKSFPKGRQISQQKVIRGGSWAQPEDKSLGWFRTSSKVDYAWKDVGFRCVKSMK